MMKNYFYSLALVVACGLSQPCQAQISKFHGEVGLGGVSLNSTAPVQNNPNGYSGLDKAYVLQTTNATLFLLNLNFGYDAPLLQMSEGEQSLGVSLNVAGGLLGTTRQDVQGFNEQLILDFPEYFTYRYGARASKHSKKDFGVGVGLGYRFCNFFLPFNAPSAMLEGVYATAEHDYYIRFSTDLRSMRFYNDYSSEGLVEVLRIREFNVQIGRSF